VSLSIVIASVIVVSMVIYVASGGADFGSGIWDLLATGPRAERQRDALWTAIAPIWEANHVWLIIALVLMFVAYPAAFSTILTALHIPVTLMLIGIVLRGSAFAFRSYSAGATHVERRSATIFAVASVATPLMLGVTAGAIASGDITVNTADVVQTDFVSAWLAPFPFAIGFFTLSLCAFLAAVYMTVELDDDRPLQEDFRRRGLWAAVAVGVTAFLSLFLAVDGAPTIWHGLSKSVWALPFHAATGLSAVGAIFFLWRRRFRLARALAIAQTALIITGWGLAQYPYIVPPDLTLQNTAAPDSVLWPVIVALGVGSVVLVPSFSYLYRVFKS
jgi:cytochrome d ubiquinol oxidase subunit II